jgi:hypothetical protein
MEWDLTGETEVLREKLSQRQFIHHKRRMTWIRIKLEPSRWETGD